LSSLPADDSKRRTFTRIATYLLFHPVVRHNPELAVSKETLIVNKWRYWNLK